MRCHARRGERATALHLYQQCAAVLKHELGIQPGATTRLTYREILDLDADVPPAPARPRLAAYPLVGRDAEWRALSQAWQAAAAGHPGLFLIRGEAGMGKTRLGEELMAWCGTHGVRAVATRCYAGEDRLAYAPISSWLKADALRSTLTALDVAWLGDVARLCPELVVMRSDVPPPEGKLESWQRLRFFESLARVFRSAAPLVLVVDDLHWADADTIEWLHFFLRSAGDTPCLVVGTVRAGEEQDNAPLGRLLAQLERERLVSAVTLVPLSREATAQLASDVAGEALDEAAQARTFRETEGHPLFIVELGLMDTAAQSDDCAGGGRGQSPVQSVLAERLARLSDDARAAAEVAAAVGRDFRFDVLLQAGDLEEEPLVRALDELWSRHIVRVQPDERWDFSHDRLREAAYEGVGPARRRLVHRRIAQAMELLHASRLDEVSAAIAMHLERGGQPLRAIPFLERAASVATRVSAHEEAIRCLTQALSLLERLPAGRERDAHELSLRERLSVALNSGRGYAAPEVEENLQRALALSRGGQEPAPVRWLWVAFSLRFMLGDLAGARDAAEQAIDRSRSDPACLCEAHHAMGGTLVSLGELDAAREHFEAALAACDTQSPQWSALGSDLCVFAHGWYSHALWLLGDDTAALRHAEQAIAIARARDHPYSLTLACAYAALLHQMRRDTDTVVECSSRVVELCDRYEFAYYGDWARVLLGWAHGRTHPDEGMAAIETALGHLDTQRAQARRPYYLSLLAETCDRAGEHARARTILTAAVAMAKTRGDTWWLPAIYLQQSEYEAGRTAVATRQRALDLARAQNSRGLERRILAWSPAPARA
jgi:predicted ATPase